MWLSSLSEQKAFGDEKKKEEEDARLQRPPSNTFSYFYERRRRWDSTLNTIAITNGILVPGSGTAAAEI